MKTITAILMMLVACSTTQGQTTYEILKDSVTNQNMLVGGIHKKDLSTNPNFEWYAESQKIYPTPNADAVKALQAHKDDLYFILFGGTWCEDTHFVLPKFFKIQEAAAFPESRIAMFALDRYKKMPNPVAEALGVYHVPTIIVMKDGKELGRVVEYGKTGYWDKELAEIINSAK